MRKRLTKFTWWVSFCITMQPDWPQSMGVITYLLLSGDSPFGGLDDEPLMTVKNNILRCKFAFEPAAVWDQISDSGKSFVKRLLTADPTIRPSATEAQKDDWLMIYAHADAEVGKPLSPQLIGNLREFKGFSDLHRMLLEVLSYTLRPEQIHSLKKDFEKIDPDGEGEITLEELQEVLSNNAEAGTLGSLSEAEVADIFDSLKVQKSATTIRWHEFIAAGLSKYDFDDRNLKLAFDRLDCDRKGYVTRRNKLRDRFLSSSSCISLVIMLFLLVATSRTPI